MNLKPVWQSFKRALPGTWKSGSWLLKMMIPITLAVTLLKYFGVLDLLAVWINPVFTHLGLPGSSAVIFVSGAMAGTYAGLAAMMSVHLTLRQATILGIMILLSHALPMECAVCRKTGSRFWVMFTLRLCASFAAAFCLNLILPEMASDYVYLGAAEDSDFWHTMGSWGISLLKMSAMMFGIIYGLMVIQCIIEAYGMLEPCSRFLAPLMRVFGLPEKASYMWLVGNVIGISYGSAVMLDLEEKGIITMRDANEVNYHLIMNHSMLEDTIVFCASGIPALWILGTRLSFAIITVWCRKGAGFIWTKALSLTNKQRT